MNQYKYLYFIWLIPAFFLFLILHQTAVYYGVADTYENGKSYTAEVLDFDIKQVAAQTHGYIVLSFETAEGVAVQRKLSLPIEMAGNLQGARVVPVRYQKGSYQEIVIMQTVDIQKDLVLTNLAMAFVGLALTVLLAIWVHRYSNKKQRTRKEEMVIERVDLEES